MWLSGWAWEYDMEMTVTPPGPQAGKLALVSGSASELMQDSKTKDE